MNKHPDILTFKNDEFSEINNSWLSNMHRASFVRRGVYWETSEHFYQSFKSSDRTIQNRIRDMDSPYATKNFTNKDEFETRADWNRIKLSVMAVATYYKYTYNPELRAKLLATGDCLIEEGNTWNDTYWGICRGVGENNLGKLLMKLRSALRETPELNIEDWLIMKG